MRALRSPINSEPNDRTGQDKLISRHVTNSLRNNCEIDLCTLGFPRYQQFVPAPLRVNSVSSESALSRGLYAGMEIHNIVNSGEL